MAAVLETHRMVTSSICHRSQEAMELLLIECDEHVSLDMVRGWLRVGTGLEYEDLRAFRDMADRVLANYDARTQREVDR